MVYLAFYPMRHFNFTTHIIQYLVTNFIYIYLFIEHLSYFKYYKSDRLILSIERNWYVLLEGLILIAFSR